MEAGGHYYTVYYVSLAVGFSEKVAYRHAVLAQMPDQVAWMDAAEMHIHQCTGRKINDFNDQNRNVPVSDRYLAEYALHSLPDKNLNTTTRSSEYQRQQTYNALMAESPLSLKFGLLLHRLGDTFAHSRKADETTMYTVNTGDTCFRPGNIINYDNEFGHGHDGHDPDYPFQRQKLFYSYLEKLYDVLFKKVNEPASAAFRRKNFTARTIADVKGDFAEMFANLASLARAKQEEMQERYNKTVSRFTYIYIIAPETSDETKAQLFIQEIRATARRKMNGVEMRKDYAPENEKPVSLSLFLQRQKKLDEKGFEDLTINSETLTDTMNTMIPPNARGGATGSW